MTSPYATGSFSAHPHTHGAAEAHTAAESVRQLVGSSFQVPVCGIVLGSGLGGLADRIEHSMRIPFSHVPGFPTATVSGHAGQVIVGDLGGRPIVALAGRFHMYEGHQASLAAFPVRMLHALGARVYFASNAAGGVCRTYSPGDLMVVADHMNLMFRSPLAGPLEHGDERFPDMSDAYDRDLRAQLHAAGRATGVALQDGVYCGLLGPTYETPAEVRMLERLGVDAVGMSTVPETIVARALGMRVAAVSCITNKAAGLSLQPLDHAEVMEAGRALAPRFEALVTEFVRRLQ
ncbi:MAG: purine-nucleoside phosphorylase [Gemmatimonas sp.]